MSTESTPAPQRRLVLVTGAGRSGTSTVAGTLHHLGLHVPLPVLKANESNPLGFFESWWPVRFHKRLFEIANVEQTDTRPEALAAVKDVIDDVQRDRLRTWLTDVMAESDQVVVKDPRSLFVPQLWAETAAELGVSTGYVTMLRHPAEVVGSRSTYYGAGRDAWMFAVSNLAAWVNGNLIVERETRGRPRSVVRYNDLLEDWRGVMHDVAQTCGLDLGDALTAESHPVDDFIDPSLRRHEPSWEGLDMPADLVAVAEGVFAAMSRLADSQGSDAAAEAEMDELAERYAQLVRVAQAVAQDTTKVAARAARRQGEEHVREEVAAQQAAAMPAPEPVPAPGPEPWTTRVTRAARRRLPEPVKRVLRKALR